MAFLTATLFIGDDPAFLPKYLASLNLHSETNNPDIFIINSQTGYGIDTVRALVNFFSQKPLRHLNKLAIIYNADLLLPVAQNALLKTLEEPGANNYLLLLTTKPQALLATVRSRCQTLKSQLKSEFSIEEVFLPQNKLLDNLQQTDQILAKIPKENLLAFVENQLFNFHQQFLKHPSENLDYLKKLNLCLLMLKHNVDPKSCLDFLFIS